VIWFVPKWVECHRRSVLHYIGSSIVQLCLRACTSCLVFSE
jgi:hypothetical protein